jgi:membrane fusion protein (multidrug efflux system)
VVVTPSEVVLKSEIAGRTSAFLVSEVRPQTTGIITRRLFTEGQIVKAGQPLYQIDPAQAEASLNAAKAALAQAEATQAAAQLKATRYGELIKIKAISQQEYDDSQTSLNQTTALVAAQKASVESASLGVRYTQVRSPITGRISVSDVTPGALVTANQTTPLTTVQDVSTIYVDMTQSAAETLRLRRALMAGDLTRTTTSAEVSLTLDDGTTYPQKGKLEFADAAVDQGTGTVKLRARFPNPDGLLLPGMYVRARLTKGVVAQGLLVPQGAVSRNPRGAATAYTVGPDGTAKLKVITVSEMVGNQWLVTEGLEPGDKVIVEGLMRLKPEAKIKASPAKTGAKPAAGTAPAQKPAPSATPAQ